MSREMLINVAESEECRVAVVENGNLEELYIERGSLASHVGNIYKGKVFIRQNPRNRRIDSKRKGM